MAAEFCKDDQEIRRSLNLQKESYSVKIQKGIKIKRTTATTIGIILFIRV